jgi:hypothetical protein
MQTDRSNTELFNALLPLAALVPLTEQALHALPDIHVRRGIAVIYAWPFRIGRESRMLVDEKSGQIARLERYRPAGLTPTNDLYLIDEGQLLSISREHLLIERKGPGFEVRDRNSACGFLVDGTHVGGEGTGGTLALQDGQILTLGWKESPYRYRFVDFTALAAAAHAGA